MEETRMKEGGGGGEEEEEEEEEEENQQQQQILRVLELLKQASHDLQSNPTLPPTESNSSAINALLELHTQSQTILSHPNLSQLSHHLSSLKTLVDTHPHRRRTTFLRRRVSTHRLAHVAGSIESELQSWIDREFLHSLVMALRGFGSESELTHLLIQFHGRVSQGFSLELQDLVLKSGVFSELEAILCDPTREIRVREECGFVIEGLIRFNKNVFVGQVLMGPTIKALISMGSISSLGILCSLIKSIKSPLVDEIESNKQIGNVIGFLSSEDLGIQVIGFDCVLEMGYFGRKEAIEGMIREEIVEKLMELQRSEKGGDLIDVKDEEEDEEEEENRGEGERERHPFASCVARFAVQLEVGEGLRKREKRGFKQEILRRVREASVSDAEAATIQAEVLWGSFS